MLQILKRVREIQIRTGRQVADVLAGQYGSVFKGRGIEFDEVRPYVPGDEVRSIDWNVTARYGAPFVKRYVEERQLTLMVMADISASQDFGSGARSKREAAAELAALLAFSASINNDKVGLTLFHGDIEEYIPPRKGQKHALRIVREVLSHECGATRGSVSNSRRRRWLPFGRTRSWWRTGRQATNLAGAMQFLLSVCKRKTVCFVVSDYFATDYLKSLQMAARKHDVIAVLITDPRECQVPNVGLLNLLDAESGQTAACDTSSAQFRHTYQDRAEARVKNLAAELAKARIDLIQIDASASIVEPLAAFFRMRERRRRH